MSSQGVLLTVLSVVAAVVTQEFVDYQTTGKDVVSAPFVLRLRRSFAESAPIPYEYVEQIPSYRLRRQTVFGGVTPGNPGSTATIGASGTIFNQNGHRVDGHGQVSRTFNPTGPTSIGGGLNYQGPRGGASVNADHTRHLGTDVGVTGNANLWRSPNGRSNLDGTANYNRHFGGPFGNSRPNYGAGLQFNHRFWVQAIFQSKSNLNWK